MQDFQRIFQSTIENSSGLFGAVESGIYVSKVETSIEDAVSLINKIATENINKGEHFLKGDIAEAWHAGTLLVDAARQSRQGIWAEIPRDHTPVDMVYGSSKTGETLAAQIKYYGNSEDTAKALSHPKYDSLEKIGPSNQFPGIKEAAQHEASRNTLTRPEQASQYRHTSEVGSDHASIDGVNSKPLSEPDALKLAKDYKKGDGDPHKLGLTSSEIIKLTDIARESFEAAAHAAIFAAAIKSAPHLWAMFSELLNEGSINKNTIDNSIQDILTSSAGVGARAGISAAITGICRAGLIGESFKSVSPAAIGAATVVALNSIKYGIQLSQDEITGAQFTSMCLRDSITVTAGLIGATAGQALIPIPVLGALIGNVVGTLVGSIVYQGGNSVVLGICADNNWTFFGIVDQDYQVPQSILNSMDCELFVPERFKPDRMTLEKFEFNKFIPEKLDIVPLRRGVVRLQTIGYSL